MKQFDELVNRLKNEYSNYLEVKPVQEIDPREFLNQIDDAIKNGPESDTEAQTITDDSDLDEPIRFKVVKDGDKVTKVLIDGFHRVRKAIEVNHPTIPAIEEK